MKVIAPNPEWAKARFELEITPYYLACKPPVRFNKQPPASVWANNEKWFEWVRGNYVPPFIEIDRP